MTKIQYAIIVMFLMIIAGFQAYSVLRDDAINTKTAATEQRVPSVGASHYVTILARIPVPGMGNLEGALVSGSPDGLIHFAQADIGSFPQGVKYLQEDIQPDGYCRYTPVVTKDE